MSEPRAERLAAELREQVGAARTAEADYLSRLEAAGPLRRAVFAVDAEVDAPDPALALLTDSGQPASARLQLLQRLAAQLSRRDDAIAAMLAVVRNRDDDAEVREAALDVLGSAAFQVARFRPHQRAYEDVLHDLVDDPVPGLRETAVTTLAQQRDPAVQRILLDGLRDGGDLPVGRDLAVRLLAEDDHLDVLPLLEEMYRDGSPDARQESVRFMGAYPRARETLEAILRDRDETPEVRQQSAASLRYLAPESYEAVAKDIATDADEHPDVRAASLATLRHLTDRDRLLGDADFVGRVQQVGREQSAPDVARMARELLDEGGRA